MPKYILFFIVSVLLILSQVSAQSPLPVERKSTIKLELKRSSKRTFSIVLGADDVLGMGAQAEGTINLKISDPNGQVLYQGIIKSRLVEWQKTITVEGNYTVEIESVALLSNTRISLSISVLKPDFVYGHPSMDSLISKRSRKTLVDGEFEITRSTPKSYSYSVLKGDTLVFSLKPISGQSPTIEIQNSLNELVFASFSSKKEQYAEIPIFESGTYSITMSSSAFFPKTNFIQVEAISPARYAEKVEVPVEQSDDTLSGQPQVLYDTIPEIYMDTTLFIGAQRDIIHPNRQKLEFQFDNPSTVIKWLVLYGAGKEFTDAVNSLSSLLAGEALAAGATNILTAYGLGFLKKLPDQGSDQIKFTPSPSIKNKLRFPIRNNYATIDRGSGNHSLLIENKSQSSGQYVHVQVVVFRKLRLDN